MGHHGGHRGGGHGGGAPGGGAVEIMILLLIVLTGGLAWLLIKSVRDFQKAAQLREWERQIDEWERTHGGPHALR